MDFAAVLRAYRTFDPAAWVGAYRVLPIWAGLLCLLLGVTLLLVGGGRFFRWVAGPLAGLAGLLWVPVVALRLGLSAREDTVGLGAAVLLAAAAFAAPPVATFALLALPLGLTLGGLAGSSDWLVGFLPGFLLGGAVGSVLTRPLAAVVSSVAGAWLVVIGLLSSLHVVGGLSAAMAAHTLGLLIAAGLFSVAGAFYQLAVRPSPEEAVRLAAEKARARRRLQEKRALEERWANYSGGKKP